MKKKKKKNTWESTLYIIWRN